MNISIIIPTYNPGAETVGLLAQQLRGQSLPHTLCVVDSSSSDGSTQAWPEGSLVHTIPKADFGHGRTRNLGARLAGGDILVFVTQDVLPVGEGWLDTLTRPLRQGEAVASFGRQLPKADAGPLERFSRAFNYPAQSRIKSAADVPELGIKAFFFSNVCSAVKAEVFWEVGGFPEEAILNEDMILAAKLLRAGYRIKYQAEAQVFHSHSYSLSQQFRRNFDIGVSLAQAGPILQGARSSGAGLRFVREQVGYVAHSGRWWLLPNVALESAAKFVAFHLGKREQRLPVGLKKRLSMHSYHWDEHDAGTDT